MIQEIKFEEPNIAGLLKIKAFILKRLEREHPKKYREYIQEIKKEEEANKY